MEALERRKQKPDDCVKELSNRKAPEAIRDVKGDGNCYFRCISAFFNGDEDKRRYKKKCCRDIKGEQRSLQTSGGWGL